LERGSLNGARAVRADGFPRVVASGVGTAARGALDRVHHADRGRQDRAGDARDVVGLVLGAHLAHLSPPVA
jgi:hypothetical protein